MPRFDWREIVVDENYKVAHHEWTEQEIQQRRGEWKQNIVASYIPWKEPSSKSGIIPAALKMLVAISKLVMYKVEFKEMDMEIGPEEAAMVIRDGQILGTYTQKQMMTGGFVAWLKSLVGINHSYRLLLVDLAPFCFEVDLGDDLTTQDFAKIQGEAHFEMQVVLDKIQNLLALFRGMDLLHVEDVRKAFDTHLKSRVFVPMIARRNVLEIRTSREIQDALQRECQEEIARYYGDFGLYLRGLTIEWRVSQAEKEKIAEQEAQSQDRLSVKKMERIAELGKVKSKIELGNQDLAFESTKKTLLHQSELEKLDYELREVQKREREKQRKRAELEVSLETCQNALEIKKIQIEMQKLDMDLADLNNERALKHKQKQQAIEREHLKGVLEIERDDDLVRQSARAVQEIQKLEIQQQMSPEQLMSLASFQSTAASQAMGEKFKAQAASSEDKTRAMADMIQKQMSTVHQMALNHGNQMADVASAASSKTSPPPRCPSCNKETNAGWRSCPYCGKGLWV